MEQAIICDIDGTLTEPIDKNDKTARGFFDWNRVLEDKPNKAIIYVVRRAAAGKTLIIVSGRKEQSRADTITWLKRDGIEFNYLYLRADDDNSSGVECKTAIYNNHVRNEFEVIASFDNDPETSKMWSSFGICTLQILP